MPHSKNILIKNIKSLLGIMTEPYLFKKGKAMSFIDSIENAWLLIIEGQIKDFGDMSTAPLTFEGQTIDATNQLVMPAWCDSHTHLVFATSREKEFVMRIKGKSYEEIAKEGGGILNSARKLHNVSEDELYASAKKRLDKVIKMGTGAIEIKSGYGLSYKSELKMLRVINRLKANSDATIKSTFLGAHAIPLEFKRDRSLYIELITNKLLPKIGSEKLADYCDVFCEKGFFTNDETDLILKAAAKFNLKPKIHANQLSNSGAVQVGIANNAVSVDHLEEIADAEIVALKNSKTIPTLLPSCSFFLGIPFGPARKMIDAGLGVCLASDYNPGSTPSGNIPFVMSLSCIKMKLLPEEAFNAVTINGAHAMELEKDLGSITKRKLANIIITNEMENLSYIPYSFGESHIDKVILNGKIQ